MTEYRSGQRESFTGRRRHRTHRMTQCVRGDTFQASALYDAWPDTLRALEMRFGRYRRKDIICAILPGDTFQQGKRSGGQWPD